MKETSFIEKNKDKWKRFENLSNEAASNPEELSNLYIDITNDLAFAQTHYQRRTVRVYLNQLAQKVFIGVNKYKKEAFKKLLKHLTVSIPLEIYRARKTLLTALIAFSIYVLIGVVSTIYYPDFPRFVMGDAYVDMTIENIEAGNPLGVYQSSDQLSMFIQITTNNLMVSFLIFFVGILFTVGTHVMLFSNGVMLGAFQYYFHTKGLLITSFLGIWIHGAFEISAIILAGGAGITAGNGWLFPGSFTRFQSLKIALRRSVKIMLLLIPFIVLAGFLESFVTRNYATLPDWSKWGIIGFSFFIMALFFIVLPFYVAKKHPHLLEEEVNQSQNNRPIVFYSIKNLGEILRDTLLLYFKLFSSIFSQIFAIFLPLIFLLILLRDYLQPSDLGLTYWYDWAGQLEFIVGYGFYFYYDYVLFFIWLLLLTFISAKVFYELYKIIILDKTPFNQFLKSKFFPLTLSVVLVFVPLFILPWNYLLVYLFVFPFFQLIFPFSVFGKQSILKNTINSIKLSGKNYFLILFSCIVLSSVLFIFAQPIALVFSIVYSGNQEPFMPDLLDILSSFTIKIADAYNLDGLFWSNILRQFVYIVFLFLILPFYFILNTFIYFSLLEKFEAKSLVKQFTNFGKRDRFKESTDFEG